MPNSDQDPETPAAQPRHPRWSSLETQRVLALIFIGLGGWALCFPGMVESLVFRPEYQTASLLTAILIGCFGAQAVLCGLALFFGRLSPLGFVVFGLFGSVPFFVFNYYFVFVLPVFTNWMILDFVGNIGILTTCLFGALQRRQEDASAAQLGS